MLRIVERVILSAVLVVSACSKKPAPKDGDTSSRAPLHELESPAGPGSAEPDLVVAGGRVYMTWLQDDAAGHALQYSSLDADRWSAPRTIASGADLLDNWADFPALAPLADGTFAVHWPWKYGSGGEAYGVRVARSFDGSAWSAPLVPHHDRSATEHGFACIVPEPLEGATVIWLDGREYASRREGDPGGRTCLMTADLRRGSFGPEQVLDPRVCDCCQTAAVRTSRGVLVAYRDRSEDEVRDIALVRRDGDQWTQPYLLSHDGWRMPGCPVNGPALAANGNAVAAAWFTAGGDSARVLVAFSSDGGATFGQPVRCDAGRTTGRVALAVLDNGDALVTWIETDDAGRSEIRARRVHAADLARDPDLRIAATKQAPVAGVPRVAVAGGFAYFAWTEDADPPRVRAAKLAL